MTWASEIAEEVFVDDRRQQLLAAIEAAFHDVELGDGVSLHESVVIDKHGGPEDRRTARELDEKRDWRRLVVDSELARIGGFGGLNFYDAAGLRFHLPAYLSLAVIDFERYDAGETLEGLMHLLTDFCDYNLSRFNVLDDAQRHCVRDVLLHLREEYELESVELDQAIGGYWGSGPRAADEG